MKKDLTLNLVSLDTEGIPNVTGQYWEYFISGQSLKDYLGIPGCKDVSPFGWFLNKEMRKAALRMFRFQEKSKLIDGRVELYLCAACGDIGCGSITVKMEDRGDSIVWRDFAATGNLEEIGELFKVEALEFAREDYFRAFASIR